MWFLQFAGQKLWVTSRRVGEEWNGNFEKIRCKHELEVVLKEKRFFSHWVSSVYCRDGKFHFPQAKTRTKVFKFILTETKDFLGKTLPGRFTRVCRIFSSRVGSRARTKLRQSQRRWQEEWLQLARCFRNDRRDEYCCQRLLKSAGVLSDYIRESWECWEHILHFASMLLVRLTFEWVQRQSSELLQVETTFWWICCEWLRS